MVKPEGAFVKHVQAVERTPGKPARWRENPNRKGAIMPILLWLLGVPIPIIILLLLFYH